ncbi:Glutamate racemase [Serratia odorifera]|uniref:Glutamate racemase n=1 Tax=Serratia odorifera TaxID=618 RepID=A0A447KP09_SEROD|nr:Glutamate racemase [Serratia odorifera]
MATLLQEENTPSLEAIPSNSTATPRPTVLVFDSGVGGLSVYQEVRQLLPDLHYIYAFDNVAFPYGEKSEQFIVERVLEIVGAVQQRYPLAIVIIACNTASTVSLPALRARFSFPVVGVVPAIKPAAKLTANGIVGLLATRGTVQRSYTHELIARFATDCKIELLGSSELVELAEAKLHGEEVPLAALKKILQPWLSMREPPDTVVLGCTHFRCWPTS